MDDDGEPGSDGDIDDALRQPVRQIQQAIQSRGGKSIPEEDILDILRGPLTDVIVTLRHRSYSGPIPSPDMLADYEEVHPGAASLILSRMMDEQKHRHAWENRALEITYRERRRRDYGAYILVACGLALAGLMVGSGRVEAAAWFAGSIILGGGALVLGRTFLATHNEDGTNIAVNPDRPGKPESRDGAPSRRKPSGTAP